METGIGTHVTATFFVTTMHDHNLAVLMATKIKVIGTIKKLQGLRDIISH